MRTFERYLADNIRNGVIDFSLRATIDDTDRRTGEKFSSPRVTFYIHPANKDGDTADFIVKSQTVITASDTLAQAAATARKESQ